MKECTVRECTIIKDKLTDLKEYKIANKFKDLGKEQKIEMLKRMFDIRYFEMEVEQYIFCLLYTSMHSILGLSKN